MELCVAVKGLARCNPTPLNPLLGSKKGEVPLWVKPHSSLVYRYGKSLASHTSFGLMKREL